ncbi:MAG: hypothetical protein KJO25_04900, partial [Bacteroidia bacterium]|nr:hypothetical protein [Bacteroidia bacterium]
MKSKDYLTLTDMNITNELTLKKYLTIITTVFLMFIGSNLSFAQCTATCTADTAGAGEQSCVSIGDASGAYEIGLDALNATTDPIVVASLGGNTLVVGLDNCCGFNNVDNCMSVDLTVPAGGGCFSFEEINNIGSGRAFIDCTDLNPIFDSKQNLAAGSHEMLFCPPGGSGSKRIGIAPLFVITATPTDETCIGANDGVINASFVLGNLNVPPDGTGTYSIDGAGGPSSNTTGIFTGLAPGVYTLTVYDSADVPCFNTVQVTINASASVCASCNLTGSGLSNIICNDNGTSSDPSDDTFTFDLNPAGTDLGATYSVSGDVTQANVAYGAATNFGPFPIAGGDLTITITDDVDGSCQIIDLAVTAPATCSAACNLTGSGLANIVCN